MSNESTHIYSLGLHETVSTNNGMHNATRVPGGWIYQCWRYIPGSNGDYEQFAAVFVPFNNEFQESVK